MASKQTVPVREHHISDYNKDTQALPPGSSERGDERPTTEPKCQCGKFGKNLRGLKIHQARTKCGSGKKQRNSIVVADQTMEDHSKEEHYSAEDL